MSSAVFHKYIISAEGMVAMNIIMVRWDGQDFLNDSNHCSKRWFLVSNYEGDWKGETTLCFDSRIALICKVATLCQFANREFLAPLKEALNSTSHASQVYISAFNCNANTRFTDP